jgi:hypothetical protein
MSEVNLDGEISSLERGESGSLLFPFITRLSLDYEGKILVHVDDESVEVGNRAPVTMLAL